MRTLALLVLAVLASDVHAQPDRRGALYAGGGVFATPTLFDEDGVRYDSSVVFTAYTAEIGGELVVYRGLGSDGTLEVALHLARADLEGGDFGSGVTTGVEPRNLVLALRLDGQVFSARLGAYLDLTKRPTILPGAFTTDGQQAVHLGVGAAFPTGPLRFETGVDAFLTVARALDDGGRLDDGDVYAVYAEGRYPLGPFEAGLRLQYVTISDVTGTLDGQAQTFPDSDSAHLGLIPSVTVRPPGLPLDVTLQAGARGGAVQEYADYGIALLGRNAPADALPLALRVRYGF